MGLSFAIGVFGLGSTARAQEQGVIRPALLLSEIVQGMPKGEGQEVRVLRASFQPGDKTLSHTHRFPVTVYVLEGTFTLEMEGREPVTVQTGQAMVMPPRVKMTGCNRSSVAPLELVIFSVSDPDTPFLDPIPQATGKQDPASSSSRQPSRAADSSFRPGRPILAQNPIRWNPVADELLDDPERLKQVLLETAASLPAPKPRTPKGRKTRKR